MLRIKFLLSNCQISLVYVKCLLQASLLRSVPVTVIMSLFRKQYRDSLPRQVTNILDHVMQHSCDAEFFDKCVNNKLTETKRYTRSVHNSEAMISNIHIFIRY